MKNKQWFIFIFVVLLLVHMYSFATTKNANNIQNTSETSLESYVPIKISNGKLDNVEIKLSNSPSLFLRIHKSYLVNLSYIRAISGKKARLINELVLPISDDRKDNVRKQYVKCLGEDISERDN